MSVKIGDIELGSQVLDTEFRVIVLERVIDILIQKMPLIGSAISTHEINQIRKDAVELLQKKYPNSGISLKVG